MKVTAGPAIKCTLEHHRKEGVSEEAFTQWFTEQYLLRAVQIMKKHNISKYAVVSGLQITSDDLDPGLDWKSSPSPTDLTFSQRRISKSAQLSKPRWVKYGRVGR